MSMIREFEIWARKNRVGKIFAREVGLYRRNAMDEVDLISYIDENRGVDCYSAIFANWQIRRRQFDTIFLDVDGHENENGAEENIFRVIDVLDGKGIKYRLYDSGRGYHVYIDFDVVRLEHYGSVVRKWVSDIGIMDYVDKSVVGDIRRMARIPATINSKTGTVMRRISDCNGYNDWLAHELTEMDEVFREKDGRERRNCVVRIQIDLKLSELPLCVREGIETMIETGELEHIYRVAIAIFLLKAWGVEKTKKVFELASDYNESKTEYQLSFLERKGYYCYSCRRLKELGICRYDDMRKCMYYVMTDGWLENLFDEVSGNVQ